MAYGESNVYVTDEVA